MMRNNRSLDTLCPRCHELEFQFKKAKDSNRALKLQIVQLEDILHKQKVDVAHARKVAEDEKNIADELHKRIESLTVSHHLQVIEMKRDSDAANTKLTLQLDREKGFKAEMKTQLDDMKTERDDSNGLMLQYKDSLAKFKKCYEDLQLETSEIIK